MARRVTSEPTPDSPRIRDRASFGAWIRLMRTRQGLRIDDAAALCGVSVQLLSALETGRRSVGLDKALHVAEQLGLALLVVPTDQAPDALRALESSS